MVNDQATPSPPVVLDWKGLAVVHRQVEQVAAAGDAMLVSGYLATKDMMD